MENTQTTFRLRLRNEPEATGKLRAALSEAAEASNLLDEARFELKVAATEALTNAVKGPPGEHAVEVAITAFEEGVEVEVADRRRFAPQTRVEGPLEAEGGRGIPLMLALVDEVEFTSARDGTRMRKRARAAHRTAS